MLFNRSKRQEVFRNYTDSHVGPGTYNIPREFGVPVKKSKPVKPAESITNLLRELDPNYYEKSERPVQMIFVKKYPKKIISFGKSSRRFPQETKLISPGVGEYNMETELSKKQNWHNRQQVAFDTTFPKSQTLTLPPHPYPGPNHYNVKPTWTKDDKWISKRTPYFPSDKSKNLFTPLVSELLDILISIYSEKYTNFRFRAILVSDNIT
ncbi:uncharacterized protein [Centruroides vittatus]|uniref:uncharacterized protein n=1 Tax=Centruroides vittatus TaxID=120091 RepID=UPI00350F2937